MNISGVLDLAALGGGMSEATVSALSALGMSVDAQHSRVSISLPLWRERDALGRLALLRSILALALADGQTGSLTWLFSGVRLDRKDMIQVLKSWKRPTNPPLLFIMDIARGRGFVRTVGLSTLASKEVEVHHEGEDAKNAIVFAIRAGLHLVGDGIFSDGQRLIALPLSGSVLADQQDEVVIELEPDP